MNEKLFAYRANNRACAKNYLIINYTVLSITQSNILPLILIAFSLTLIVFQEHVFGLLDSDKVKKFYQENQAAFEGRDDLLAQLFKRFCLGVWFRRR